MIAVQDLACYFTGTGVQSSFCAESVEALDLTERAKAGLLSRAPVKSSDVGVTLWHFLTPISELGQEVALARARTLGRCRTAAHPGINPPSTAGRSCPASNLLWPSCSRRRRRRRL